MQAADLTLILAQAGGFAASIYNPRWWANFDAKAIRANGSADTLLSTFHRQRATWRLVVALAVGLLGVLPLLITAVIRLLDGLPAFLFGGGWLTLLLFAGQFSFNLLYFFAEFNPRLNLATGASYKSKWFVSWNPKGSWLDRQLWRRAWKSQGKPLPPVNGPDATTQQLAGEDLEHLSTLAKWLAYVLYLLFAVAGYSLSYGF